MSQDHVHKMFLKNVQFQESSKYFSRKWYWPYAMSYILFVKLIVSNMGKQCIVLIGWKEWQRSYREWNRMIHSIDVTFQLKCSITTMLRSSKGKAMCAFSFYFIVPDIVCIVFIDRRCIMTKRVSRQREEWNNFSALIFHWFFKVSIMNEQNSFWRNNL